MFSTVFDPMIALNIVEILMQIAPPTVGAVAGKLQSKCG